MDKNFFIMGAPNAGKSTYLAALWHSINQNEVPTKLTLKEMTGDSQYLYRLEKKWLEIEVLGRTVPDQEKPELSLLLTDGNDELKLEFPDLSGETFQSIYETREITAELYRKIEQADVILYFINVEKASSADTESCDSLLWEKASMFWSILKTYIIFSSGNFSSISKVFALIRVTANLLSQFIYDYIIHDFTLNCNAYLKP